MFCHIGISSSLVVSGTPTLTDPPSTTFRVRATDDLGAYAEATFVISIDPNTAVASTAITDQTVLENVAFSFDFASYFSDADGDTLRCSITASTLIATSTTWLGSLPSNSLTVVLAATLVVADRGTYQITVSCYDDIPYGSTTAT